MNVRNSSRQLYEAITSDEERANMNSLMRRLHKCLQMHVSEIEKHKWTHKQTQQDRCNGNCMKEGRREREGMKDREKEKGYEMRKIQHEIEEEEEKNKRFKK